MTRPLVAAMLALLSCGTARASVPPALFLDAFVEACLDGFETPAARAAALAAAGWRPVSDTADPTLARVMDISRQALRDAETADGAKGAVAAFARPLAGADAFLVTTEFAMPSTAEDGVDTLGCYLYDFAADQPLDPDRITERFDEAPAATEGQDGVILADVWNLGASEGVFELRSTFIPKGSPAITITGFAGRGLSVTTLWQRS